MAYEKLRGKLLQGTRLTYRDVRAVLKYLGYKLARQKGSHEQWVKAGKTFTLACHSKEVPFYILDTIKKMVKEHEKSG